MAVILQFLKILISFLILIELNLIFFKPFKFKQVDN